MCMPDGFTPEGISAFANLYAAAHRAAPWLTGVVTGAALAAYFTASLLAR